MRRLPFARHLPVGKLRYRYTSWRPPDGGVWTGPKVARYVRDRWQVTVCPETGWRWLVALGFSLQVPRPSHPRAADRPRRRAWKKTCGGG
jgi:transposase